MVYAGERWNSFKNSLTSRYLVERGKKFGMSAANDYSYIDKQTWKTFVKSRENPSFLKEGTESFAREKYDGG
ncbi:hypothetical protein QL285_034642 [Trifolium repens]|nr:hypothetical protein QL285_034642 [Trifolium repens]